MNNILTQIEFVQIALGSFVDYCDDEDSELMEKRFHYLVAELTNYEEHQRKILKSYLVMSSNKLEHQLAVLNDHLRAHLQIELQNVTPQPVTYQPAGITYLFPIFHCVMLFVKHSNIKKVFYIFLSIKICSTD